MGSRFVPGVFIRARVFLNKTFEEQGIVWLKRWDSNSWTRYGSLG
jgi:hypothetical protein